MKYVVTYCASDPEAGSNLLWHSSILLSKMDEETKLLEVVDNWGFYGVPTTGNPNGFITRIKLSIGLNVDLQGNHGMLRHEELRFLDLGFGLHGTSFELTQEQFELLQKQCVTMAEEQESAIREVVGEVGGKPSKKTRIYPYEEISKSIYEVEKFKARQQQRPPRLKPFELRLSWGLWGPGLEHSYTCKSQTITLLSTVLSEKQLNRLTENGWHPTVPRFSGPMESIYLHSTGPIRKHQKASGEVVAYRDFSDKDVRLYWTLPPQNIETIAEDTKGLFQVDDEYCSEIKLAIRKLQRLEWLLRSAVLPSQFDNQRVALMNQVIASYKAFSVIQPKPDLPQVSGWQGFAYSLFSWPRSANEQGIQYKLKQAKMLFNSLYMALVDGWNLENNDHDVAVEAVVSYLPVADQKKLCHIIGRHYVTPEPIEDEESSALQVG